MRLRRPAVGALLLLTLASCTVPQGPDDGASATTPPAPSAAALSTTAPSTSDPEPTTVVLPTPDEITEQLLATGTPLSYVTVRLLPGEPFEYEEEYLPAGTYLIRTVCVAGIDGILLEVQHGGAEPYTAAPTCGIAEPAGRTIVTADSDPFEVTAPVSATVTAAQAGVVALGVFPAP